MLEDQAVFHSFPICFISNNNQETTAVISGKIMDVTSGQNECKPHFPTQALRS